MSQNTKPRKTIFVLYVPGGGMLGAIPAVALARLEELTETPSAQLFQASEAVSTGIIVTSALQIPGMSASRIVEHYCADGAKIFHPMPGRATRMVAGNIANFLLGFLDPGKADEFILLELKKLTENLKIKMPLEEHSLIDDLYTQSAKRWMTLGDKEQVLVDCASLSGGYPELEQEICSIGELALKRTSRSRVKNLFNQAATRGLEKFIEKFCPPEKIYFDSDIPLEIFQTLFGDLRLSDCQQSVYFSTYDVHNNKVLTLFNSKDDPFSQDVESPRKTSPGDHKLWDVILAGTANPFGFKPHVTEDGIVCVDKAIVHPPFMALQDILKKKPDDTDIKLVILGTGKGINKLPEGSAVEYYKAFGVLGNLLRGREIAELEGYIMSISRSILGQIIGEDNVIEISPRLAPQGLAELLDFPSRDTLDASEENVKKILKQARALLVKEDDKVRGLAQMLADNLYLVGQMDKEKYTRVSRKIGIKAGTRPLESGIGKDIPGMYERIFGKPSLSRLFKRLTQQIIEEENPGQQSQQKTRQKPDPDKNKPEP